MFRAIGELWKISRGRVDVLKKEKGKFVKIIKRGIPPRNNSWSKGVTCCWLSTDWLYHARSINKLLYLLQENCSYTGGGELIFSFPRWTRGGRKIPGENSSCPRDYAFAVYGFNDERHCWETTQ